MMNIWKNTDGTVDYTLEKLSSGPVSDARIEAWKDELVGLMKGLKPFVHYRVIDQQTSVLYVLSLRLVKP